MEILTAERFFILTQPRCFSCWLSRERGRKLQDPPSPPPSTGTFILGQAARSGLVSAVLLLPPACSAGQTVELLWGN